jgi:hypothetical protein
MNSLYVNFEARLGIYYMGFPTFNVKDSSSCPTDVTRLDKEIPEWMHEHVHNPWGYIQDYDQVTYWFTDKDDALLFKLTFCED